MSRKGETPRESLRDATRRVIVVGAIVRVVSDETEAAFLRQHAIARYMAPPGTAYSRAVEIFTRGLASAEARAAKARQR